MIINPVTLGILGAAAIPASRYAPQIGRGARALWGLGRSAPSFIRGAVRDPSGAARKIWDPLMRGTGWGRRAEGIPRVPATPARPAVRPGDPGTRLPPGGRFSPASHTVPGPISRMGGHTTRTKVYPPSARTVGARPATPAIPGSPAAPAGFARRHPWVTSGILGGAGMTVGSLLQGDPEQAAAVAAPQPVAVGGPPLITGDQPAVDKWHSDLPTLLERKQKERRHFNKNMKMILGHSMLLSFQNPGRKSNYIANAIELLKADAASRGSVEDAKIIDDVFKDKKVPKTAKILYNRLVNHMSPKEAAEVSGYTLDIEKAEAKAYADLMDAQSKLVGKRASQVGKDTVRMEEIRAVAEYDFEAAVQMLADAWISGKTLKLSDTYGGLSAAGRTIEEIKELARNALIGRTATGQGAGIPENQTVGTITTVN
jgi:hypothetical protein